MAHVTLVRVAPHFNSGGPAAARVVDAPRNVVRLRLEHGEPVEAAGIGPPSEKKVREARYRYPGVGLTSVLAPELAQLDADMRGMDADIAQFCEELGIDSPFKIDGK